MRGLSDNGIFIGCGRGAEPAEPPVEGVRNPLPNPLRNLPNPLLKGLCAEPPIPPEAFGHALEGRPCR